MYINLVLRLNYNLPLRSLGKGEHQARALRVAAHVDGQAFEM